MPGGRPPKGADLVDRLEGSEEAKQRMKIVLETIQGKRSVREATELLNVSASRFHAIREKALSGAVSSLEPGSRGRPPSEAGRSPEMEALHRENERLKEAVAREKARADVAEILSAPRSSGGEGEEERGGKSRAERRRALKAERRAQKKTQALKSSAGARWGSAGPAKSIAGSMRTCWSTSGPW